MAPRTGFQTFLNFCHTGCRLLGKWEASIRAAVAASTISEPDKAKIYAAIDAIDNACAVVELVRITWES
jgi:hypothetical protein